MKIYLVGGAVRDNLLNRPVHERDWVVVGASAEQMIKKGFKPVGKDFPVFLHPQTKEEYALARTEKKIAKGYKGFEFYASPDVTLEQDLARRDLTINAIAKDSKGQLIDPYHGQRDINNKTLRHVSNAFAEDPVRILRLGRFHARFPDFSIDPDTITLVKTMVMNGEVDALVAERVWAECMKALTEDAPIRFFELLNQVHALEKIFPHLHLVTQNHQALLKACQISTDPLVRFASLCHTLSIEHIDPLVQQLKLPKAFHELITLTIKYLKLYQSPTLTAEQILVLFKQCDALRRPERFAQFNDICQACSDQINHGELLQGCLQQLQQLDIKPLLAQGLQGRALASAIDEQRLLCLQNYNR